MKTHDCHVFLERLLPLIVRDFLPRHVVDALTELSNFFRELCAKVLNKDDLDRLQDQIALTLCKLERIFPLAFFDIMVHLLIHLVWEAKVGGPIQYRWMYPIERYLRKLKCYVCNKAQPEGSIAEGYLADECLTFCSRYLRGVETKFNRPERNYDGGQHSSNTLSIFLTSGRSYGKVEVKELNLLLHNTAVLYVLQNCDESLPFIQEHKNFIINSGFRNVEQIHKEEFIGWFREKVAREGIGFKRDRCGNIVLNTKKKLNTQEPFVLASQAIQVYYLEGINDPTWSTSIEIKPRNLYEMPMDEGEPYQEEQMQCTNTNANLDDNHEDEIDWSRNVEDNSHNIDVE
ncbi:hypothetical protein LWI29_030375 [Acer saccharum]|uniref:DUF4218 domain-containing protein n=1 Tax=Acer saccharum TaxID=4024 RepID=A0AA39TNI4_ACESA|nr:hypothetical protein LWI29_030375 [Acer saccharum]